MTVSSKWIQFLVIHPPELWAYHFLWLHFQKAHIHVDRYISISYIMFLGIAILLFYKQSCRVSRRSYQAEILAYLDQYTATSWSFDAF